MGNYTSRDSCRIDGSPLIEVADFGNLYVSDFVDKEGQGDRCPLKVGIGTKSGLVQLYHSYSPERMYDQYWYHSGTNESMREALRDIVQNSKRFVYLKEGDVVLDVAGNDNTLLSFWGKNLYKVNIDPCKLAVECGTENADLIINTFFSKKAYYEKVDRPAKVITLAAMFYDLEDPLQSLKDLKACLAEDGILVIQLAYTPLTLYLNDFTDFCHEHVGFYNLTVLDKLCKQAGLRVVDVELNNTNAKSLRVYITHAKAKLNCPPHEIELGLYNKSALLWKESKENLEDPQTYIDFFDRCNYIKEETIEFLKREKEKGKRIGAFAASTKGNTMLQWYDLSPKLIENIAERSPEKFGKLAVGSWIPIISDEEMRKNPPDYLLVLAWTFMNSFIEREKELLQKGTKFIVPLPNLCIVDANGYKRV